MVLVYSGNIFSAGRSIMAAGMISVVQIFKQRLRMIRETEYFFHDGEKVLHKDGFSVLNGGYLFLYGKYFVFDGNKRIADRNHRILNSSALTRRRCIRK